MFIHVLIDWVGGPKWKIFGTRSLQVRCTESQTFSRPTRINSHSVEVFYRMMVFFSNFSDGANPHQTGGFSSMAVSVFPGLPLDANGPDLEGLFLFHMVFQRICERSRTDHFINFHTQKSSRQSEGRTMFFTRK